MTVINILACVVFLIRCGDGYGVLLDSFMSDNRTGVTRRVSLEGQETVYYSASFENTPIWEGGGVRVAQSLVIISSVLSTILV